MTDDDDPEVLEWITAAKDALASSETFFATVQEVSRADPTSLRVLGLLPSALSLALSSVKHSKDERLPEPVKERSWTFAEDVHFFTRSRLIALAAFYTRDAVLSRSANSAEAETISREMPIDALRVILEQRSLDICEVVLSHFKGNPPGVDVLSDLQTLANKGPPESRAQANRLLTRYGGASASEGCLVVVAASFVAIGAGLAAGAAFAYLP